MSVLVLLSIGLRILGFALAVAWTIRHRDWRYGFVAGMFGLMAIRQSWSLRRAMAAGTATSHFEEIPGVLVTVLALLGFVFLGRLLATLKVEVGERRRTQEALQESESSLLRAQRLARLGSFEYDLQTGRLRHTPGMYRVYNIEPEAFDGTVAGALRFIHPDDHDRVCGQIDRLRSGESSTIEYRAIDRDGQVRTLWGEAEPVLGADGKPSKIVGAVLDMTERKRADEERRAFDEQVQAAQKPGSLGVLARGIAHDFNNLLATILGNAGLALAALGEGSGEVRERLGQIEDAADRAARLTSHMLAYSGRAKVSRVPLRLDRLVEEMQRLLEVAVAKGARIEREFAAQLPPIEGDQAQIEQILMNLLTNASDALRDGRGVIRLRTSTVELGRNHLERLVAAEKSAPGAFVCLEVSDDGVGMSPVTLQRMFDPFFTTKRRGRGLGMAAVIDIVRSHHGALEVDSAPGEGTTFRVYLPVAVAGPTGEGSAAFDDWQDWRGSGAVMVVDDDRGVVEVASVTLRGAGFEVLVARNGAEGVDCLRARPDVVAIVLDMTMPVMDGREAVPRLREICPNVAIILCSGYDAGEVSDLVHGLDVDGVLPKPFRPQTLLGKLREVMAERTRLSTLASSRQRTDPKA